MPADPRRRRQHRDYVRLSSSAHITRQAPWPNAERCVLSGNANGQLEGPSSPSSQHLKNEVAAYARCPPLPPWTLRARETQEVVMVGLPKPGDIQKMLDGFHKELHAIRTLLEQLLELERERIERDQAA
jgi:hypothetical protein